MARGRCVATGCKRLASADSEMCPVHRVQAVRDRSIYAPSNTGEKDESARKLDPILYNILEKAGTDVGLNGEIGALRFVLHELLTDPDLPIAELARQVARVTAVTAQVCKAQRAISGEMGDSITDALTKLLVELDKAD